MAKKFKKMGLNPSSQKPIFYRYSDQLILSPEFTYNPFALFIVTGSIELDNDVLYSFAHQTVKNGLVHFNCWGRDSQKIHDIFVEVDNVIRINDNISTNEQTVFMDSSSVHESVDNTIDSYFNFEFPSDYDSNRCKGEYILCLGNKKLDKKIKELIKKQVKGR